MLLDFKGRIKIDAFEKFVRELPNSKSHVVMVLFNTFNLYFVFSFLCTFMGRRLLG